MFKNRNVHQMAKYQERITQLRMLRADLDEQNIVKEVQKIASQQPVTVITVLDESIRLAMAGEPMLWESQCTT